MSISELDVEASDFDIEMDVLMLDWTARELNADASTYGTLCHDSVLDMCYGVLNTALSEEQADAVVFDTTSSAGFDGDSGGFKNMSSIFDVDADLADTDTGTFDTVN